MILTLLEGYDHMSKVTDVEVSAFSECFLLTYGVDATLSIDQYQHIPFLFGIKNGKTSVKSIPLTFN